MHEKAIWNHIRTLRFQFLKKKNVDITCEDGYISKFHIISNIEELSRFLGVHNVSNDKARNLSQDSINKGAEMFVALNLCPSDFIRLYLKSIYGPQSRIAILASNIVKKVKNDLRKKAIQIFVKISSLLGFQHISYKNGYFERKINVRGEKH